MTRAVSNTFASLTNPTLPNLDADFLGLANIAAVPCTATGTNAISLTPVASTVTVSAYSDKELYSFNAPATSTGAMTLQVSGQGFLNLYRPGGVDQANASDIVNARFYIVAYQASLNSNAGGFVIVSSIVRTGTVLNETWFSDSGSTLTTTSAVSANVNSFGYSPVSTNSKIQVVMWFQGEIATTTNQNATAIFQIAQNSVAIGQSYILVAPTGPGGTGLQAPCAIAVANVTNNSLTQQGFTLLAKSNSSSAAWSALNIVSMVKEVAN